ncbi:MAG: hypothetical protein AB7O26_16770, partial [Planctomycetaceae bacterium]
MRIALCAIAILFALPANHADDRPVAKVPEIRRVYVPANKLAELSKGYEPIGRQDFENLIAGIAAEPDRPSQVWINRAIYRAEFDGESLRDGRLNAEVELQNADAALLELEPLNLTVSRLRWGSVPHRPHHPSRPNSTDANKPRLPIEAARPEIDALWGATSAGRTALLVDRPHGNLVGNWQMRGRRLAHGTEFDLHFPPAAVCDFELVLPDDRALRSNVGDVLGPTSTDLPGRKLWRIHLGSHTTCKLVVSAARPTGSVSPQIAYESDVQCSIGEDGVQVQTRINAEIFSAPTDRLQLDFPADMEIDSVSYGAGEIALGMSVRKLGSRQRVSIRLPEMMIGPTRSIRIDAFAPPHFEQRWTLPQIQIEGAVFLSGQYQLKIDSPLELRSFDEGKGFRSASAVSSTSGGETFQFRQLKRDATLTVEISRPRLALAARVISHLSIEPESWKIVSDIDWQTAAGSAFELTCALPAGWEVSMVVPRSEDSVITNWEIRSNENGSRLLSIEFLKSVNASDPKRVRVIAARVPLPAGEPLKLSTLEPRDCTSLDEWLLITHSRSISANLGSDSDFRQLSEDELPATFRESPLWTETSGKNELNRIVLNASGPGADGTVAFETRERALEARAAIRLEIARDKLREGVAIDIVPQGEAVESLLVFLSTAGKPFEWMISSGADSAALQPRRVAPTQEARWNLPAGGELWEFRLPRPQRNSFRIQGQRTGGLTPSTASTLVFVPGARSFGGRIEWIAPEDIDVESEPTGMHADESTNADRVVSENDAANRNARRAWTYRTPQDALTLRVSTPAANETPMRFAALRLRSRLSSPGAGQDYHIAQYFIDPNPQMDGFRFRTPANTTLLAVRLNGQTVRPTRQGEELVLPALLRRELNTIEVEYRSDSRTAWLQDIREIALIVTSHEILRFDWEFELPHGYLLFDEPTSVTLIDALPQIPWSSRIFGALARPVEASIFNPLKLSTWFDFGADGSIESKSQPEFSNGEEAIVDEMISETGADASAERTRRKVWRASAPRLPETLSITLWHAGRARLLSWIVLFGSILAGLLIRLSLLRLPVQHNRSERRLWERLKVVTPGARFFRSLLPIWLTATLVAAMFLPPVAAQIAGSVCIGTILAVAVPIRWFVSIDSLAAQAKRIPLGSTATLVRGSASSAILIAGLIASGWAQESPQAPPAASSRQGIEGAGSKTTNAIGGQPERYSILVPVDENGKPAAGDQSLVYVPPALIEMLRSETAARNSAAPDYLITSAKYAGIVDVRQTTALEARYRVALVSRAPQVRVRLPITNVNLDALDACKVDGKPQPVLTAAGDTGYIVELERKKGQGKNSSAQSVSHVEIVEISLKLYPVPVPQLGGSGFRIGIPQIPTGTAEIRFSDGEPPQQVMFGRDHFPMSRSGSTFATPISGSRELEVSWAMRASEAQAEYEASVVRYVTIHSTRLEYRYRIACKVRQGRVSLLDVDDPRGAF